MKPWLALTVSKEKSPINKLRKAPFFISVPKKIVRQAVLRNRIKRVLREALRSKPFFEQNKVYFFKVLSFPTKVSLASAQLMVDEVFSHR